MCRAATERARLSTNLPCCLPLVGAALGPRRRRTRRPAGMQVFGYARLMSDSARDYLGNTQYFSWMSLSCSFLARASSQTRLNTQAAKQVSQAEHQRQQHPAGKMVAIHEGSERIGCVKHRFPEPKQLAVERRALCQADDRDEQTERDQVSSK